VGDRIGWIAIGLPILVIVVSLILRRTLPGSALRRLTFRDAASDRGAIDRTEQDFDLAFASLPEDRRRDLVFLEMRRLRTDDRRAAMRSLVEEKARHL
jgi:hypothetical protein